MPAAAKARVVLIRDRSVLDASGRVRAEVVQSMLDTAVTTLTGAKDTAAAWRTIVRPDDVVGIKSNEWRYLPTPPELEAAIETRVRGAGVMRGNIAVDDQDVRRNPVFRRATALSTRGRCARITVVTLTAPDYQLEPNVTFTPDGRWVVFRSNMHGAQHVYAVEVGMPH